MYLIFVDDAPRDFHLWPVTFKINKVYPRTMVNMSAKLDEEAPNDLFSIVFTSLFPYMSFVAFNFELWPPKSIEWTI